MRSLRIDSRLPSCYVQISEFGVLSDRNRTGEQCYNDCRAEQEGNEREYIDIKEADVEDVLDRFNAIDRDPQRFAEFVGSVSAGIP